MHHTSRSETSDPLTHSIRIPPPFHTLRHLGQTLRAKRARDLRPSGRLLRLLKGPLRVARLRDALDQDAAELEQLFLLGRGALLAREV